MFGKRTPMRGLPILWGILLAGAGIQSEATTINVNDLADIINGNDGKCTLREAVIAANTNTASGAAGGECPAGSPTDTINLPGSTPALTYNLTLAGTGEDDAATGDLDIRAPMTIVGSGQLTTLIYGNDLDRIFDIHSNFAGQVEVRDVQLSHGDTAGQGGVAYNRGDLTLRRVTAFKNEADDGGAVFSTNTLTLIDCIVDGGLASDDGGGLYLTNGSNTTVTRSVFTDNEAGGSGGGVFNNGTLNLIQSQIGGFYKGPTNKTTNYAVLGGGVHNAINGNLTLNQSTIGRNEATGVIGGGGLYNEGTVNVTNSTLSGNLATNLGGNVYNRNTGGMTFLNSTVAYGTAPTGSAIHNLGTVTTTNSIFSGFCTANDLASSGGNLESPGNQCGLNLPSDQTGVPAGQLLLYPLSNYGGPTDTNKLGFHSVAIDTALIGPCPNNDQRGEVRPLDGDDSGSSICDIGAFEGEPSLFADGFETGDTSRWADEVP